MVEDENGVSRVSLQALRAPRDNFFLLSACTVLEFMPDGELMRDRFVVITRRRRRSGGNE